MASSDGGKGEHKLGHVVVIGGNGFLGHHIVRQAVEKGSASGVTSIDLSCERNRVAGAAYEACDITDQAALTALLQRLQPQAVLHTASPQASGETATARQLFERVNVGGTAAVIEACRQAGVRALVYTSSASVVSDNEGDLFNADERWPLIRGDQQREYYSETKAAAEQAVLAANRCDPWPLLTTALRPAGIFGEGDAQTLAGLLRAYRAGKSTIQIGSNSNIFDFSYVGNVAHAHLLAARALLASDPGPVEGEAFFVTNDAPCYFWDFARAVWRAAGNERGTDAVWALPRSLGTLLGFLSQVFASVVGTTPTFTRQRAVIASMTRYYNITKAKTVLGYEPLWTLQEGIDRGVAWFLQQEKLPRPGPVPAAS